MRSLLTTLYVCFFFIAGQTQSASFYMKTDATKILQTSYLSVEYILENAEGTNFKTDKFAQVFLEYMSVYLDLLEFTDGRRIHMIIVNFKKLQLAT